MKPYFYRGKISLELFAHVINNADSFQDVMRASVEAFGGKLIRCHFKAQDPEPDGFLEFPSDIQARAWNTFYRSQKGVLESTISRLLDESDLKELGRLINGNSEKASIHRK